MPKRYLKFLIYLLFSLFFFSLLFIAPRTIRPFKMMLVDAASPVIEIILFPFNEIKKIIFYWDTYKKYEKLKKDYEVLKGHVILQDEFIAENKRLKSLLELKYLSKYPVVAAYVIGRDPSNWTTAFIVERAKMMGSGRGCRLLIIRASSERSWKREEKQAKRCF